MYVKSLLRDGISFTPPTSSEYISIKLKNEVFNTVEDIFVCFACVNPEGSTYTLDIDILQQIQHDMATFKNNGKCILMGDLNGHTNTVDDFVIYDSDIDHILLPTNYSADINSARRNHDTRPTDNRGKDILDLCKSCSMKIITFLQTLNI